MIYRVIKTYDVAEIYEVEASSEEEAILYVENDEDSDSADVYTERTSVWADNFKVEIAG